MNSEKAAALTSDGVRAPVLVWSVIGTAGAARTSLRLALGACEGSVWSYCSAESALEWQCTLKHLQQAKDPGEYERHRHMSARNGRTGTLASHTTSCA
jgi:hypothetical protein